MLTRDTFVGPWAGLPVAWTDQDEFDEETYRGDVVRCCEARIPGVYTGGTTGEFYAMGLDELKAVARATVEVCHAHDTPAMIGCSSTCTLGACRRAEYAAGLGADAIQVALPFWMEVDDAQIVPFFKDVASAWGDGPLSIYETARSKKALTIDQHRAIKEAVPGYLMVKATGTTVGATAEGCAALSEFVNVFVGETLWATLGPLGAIGCCSAMVYWNPRVTLLLWEKLRTEDWDALRVGCEPVGRLHEFLAETFEPKGFTDTAYDRTGGRASGFLETSLRSRSPYLSATEEDVETWRAWYREHFPEMLQL